MLRAPQKELDELWRDEVSGRENEEELVIMRERCERLDKNADGQRLI